MGGGPSKSQEDAASRNAALATQEGQIAASRNQREGRIFDLISPFETSRMQNGLPFFNQMNDQAGGLVARAFAPERANLQRRLSFYGSALPSGFQQGALTDLGSRQAHAYDETLMQNLLTNEQAKNNAAAQLSGQQQLSNPLGFYNAAGNTNQSIMQAPLQKAGLGGLIGGIAGGAASAIPF